MEWENDTKCINRDKERVRQREVYKIDGLTHDLTCDMSWL